MGRRTAAGTLGARASAAVSTPETAIDVRCEGTGRGADPEGVITGRVPTTPTASAGRTEAGQGEGEGSGGAHGRSSGSGLRKWYGSHSGICPTSHTVNRIDTLALP